jgi:hypothetical protein
MACEQPFKPDEQDCTIFALCPPGWQIQLAFGAFCMADGACSGSAAYIGGPLLDGGECGDTFTITQ